MEYDESTGVYSNYESEKLYSASEILQLIYGLMNVYWSKGWLGRKLFQPWHDALQTLALQVAGDIINANLEDAQLVDDIITDLED